MSEVPSSTMCLLAVHLSSKWFVSFRFVADSLNHTAIDKSVSAYIGSVDNGNKIVKGIRGVQKNSVGTRVGVLLRIGHRPNACLISLDLPHITPLTAALNCINLPDPSVSPRTIYSTAPSAIDNNMRLLRTDTLELVEFVGRAPPYVILSHTWSHDEVSFEDMSLLPKAALKKKAGYSKILGASLRAAADGYEYIWVDTCWYGNALSALGSAMLAS